MVVLRSDLTKAQADELMANILIEDSKAKLELLIQPNGLYMVVIKSSPDAQERPFRGGLQDNDFDDAGPTATAPDPAPVSPEKVPTVSAGWAENYKELWKTMNIKPEWKETADAVARTIVTNQGRYASAVSGTSVPWWFIAVVHAMECSLKFTQHLHNGDPLNARTVRVPKGRPPVGAPPFTWEKSARDSISYERLDEVADWSLTSVLYHWHRYNGINNEYKKRGIPTPYLWSGSQHYRKGKYVADHEFDPDEVSGQVGAAVVLKALVNLGAVTIENDVNIRTNPAAAVEHLPSLKIDISADSFKHVAKELDYPGPLKVGSGKTSAEKRAVKRLQEWLNIHGFVTPIDSDFGDSTHDQLEAFQVIRNRQPTGELDQETWALLIAPMLRALATIDHNASSLEDAVVRVARQHINELPIEIGGNNRGPWVRLYMQGQEGESQRWCAGFVCFILAQVARDLKTDIPFKRQVGVDKLVSDAKKNGRLISEAEVSDAVIRISKVHPGYIFVVRESETVWSHTGIVLALKDRSFDTLEGNTGGEGGTDGPNARQGNRSYSKKDFLRLI